MAEQPAHGARGALAGLDEAAPGVCPAAGQRDGLASGVGVVTAYERRVGGVAVGLQGAAEARRDDALKARGGAAGVPGEDGVATGARAGPEVAELGLAVARNQIFDRRLVHLHIAAAKHAGADGFVDWPQYLPTITAAMRPGAAMQRACKVSSGARIGAAKG